jgi:hypothetical protein
MWSSSAGFSSRVWYGKVCEGMACGNHGEQFGVAHLGHSAKFSKGKEYEGRARGNQGEQFGVARLGPSVRFRRGRSTKEGLAGTGRTIWSSSVGPSSKV